MNEELILNLGDFIEAPDSPAGTPTSSFHPIIEYKDDY
jgi:hypothetical protein